MPVKLEVHLEEAVSDLREYMLHNAGYVFAPDQMKLRPEYCSITFDCIDLIIHNTPTKYRLYRGKDEVNVDEVAHWTVMKFCTVIVETISRNRGDDYFELLAKYVVQTPQKSDRSHVVL